MQQAGNAHFLALRLVAIRSDEGDVFRRVILGFNIRYNHVGYYCRQLMAIE